MENVQNVIVIGSGPSGWTAALYLARANLNPTLFSGDRSGGQLMLTSKVENFPGFTSGILGPDLMNSMREQAKTFGTEIIDAQVTSVDLHTRPFLISTSSGNFQAKSVIISTGAESIWLGVPGEKELIGSGVSSCAVCDAAFFKEKNTYVIGGGDAAMEDTLALTKFAKQVTIIHRKDSFRASKIMQDRVLNNPKVKVIWNSAVKSIQGKTNVTSITIEDVNTHAQQELPADGVFVAIGHKPTTELFAQQVTLDEKGFVLTRMGLEKLSVDMAASAVGEDSLLAYPTMTSVEGVFAAGDVVDFRYKQAITAAGFGCMAALDAQRWLEEQQ